MARELSPSNLWVLKSKGENSAFGGNLGYADQINAVYVYDTNVKNHDKLKIGDYVTIVDKKSILGFAKINSISVKRNVPKIRYRCPICNTQEHYKRAGIKPAYKCRNKHEFNKPVEQDIIVDEYSARYNSSFIPAPSKSDPKILKGYFIRWNAYYSIQSADISFLRDQFPQVYRSLNRNTKTIPTSAKPVFIVPELPAYKPDGKDARVFKIRKLPTRDGQVKFKGQLFGIYGENCMLTGSDILETIEASHICPYRGKNDHHPANGLLLRKDLHSLFDADLIGINPETRKIHLHPQLHNSYYSKFEGKTIKVKNKKFSPSKDALKVRWTIFKKAAKI